jgi:hypothetical protein
MSWPGIRSKAGFRTIFGKSVNGIVAENVQPFFIDQRRMEPRVAANNGIREYLISNVDIWVQDLGI